MKRILIDIGHPSYLHLFKHFIWIMQSKGHLIRVTTRDKDVTIQLMKLYDIEYKLLGRHYKSLIAKVWGIIKFDILLLKESLRFKPDLFVSAGSIYAAHVSWFIRRPHISFEDTENVSQIKLYNYFTEVNFTPVSFRKSLGKNQIYYNGNHELAYLHPNYFKPDISVLSELGIDKSEKFAIVRFVSKTANHDIGQRGISTRNKIKVVNELAKYSKVFITSESKLPKELEKYRISLSTEKIHDALAYASLLFGESSTMASEAAILGTPAIYLDMTGRGYTDEEEKDYQLVFNYKESLPDQEKSINKAIELIKSPDIKDTWKERSKKFIEDKIDVTAYMIWIVENYPESISRLRKEPELENNFK